MNILLTGSMGFVGRHLYPLLVNKGHKVQAFDIVLGQDIMNHEHLTEAMKDVDGVIHLAGISRVRTAEIAPVTCILTNVVGTHYICIGIKNAKNTPWLMLASTYTAPLDQSIYAKSKLAAEQIVLRSELPRSIILRLPDIHGEDDNPDKVVPTIIRKARADEEILLQNPFQMLSLMHIDKVCEEIVSMVDTVHNTHSPYIKTFRGVPTTLRSLTEQVIKENNSKSIIREQL